MDIAQSFFTGKIHNKLVLTENGDGEKYLMLLLVVKKHKESIFKFDIHDMDALQIKSRAAKGDMISITAEPYSFVGEDKNLYAGNRITSYQILKKKEFK